MLVFNIVFFLVSVILLHTSIRINKTYTYLKRGFSFVELTFENSNKKYGWVSYNQIIDIKQSIPDRKPLYVHLDTKNGEELIYLNTIKKIDIEHSVLKKAYLGTKAIG